MKMKPLWQDHQSGHFGFFCPHCRAERRIRSHPSPSRAANYARMGLVTAVFTAATWSWFAWKGLVSFVPFWVAFELIYRSRVRVDLVCPYCGFDPFLYLIDVKQARAGVEAHWRKIFQDKGIPYPGSEKSPNAAAKNGGKVTGSLSSQEHP